MGLDSQPYGKWEPRKFEIREFKNTIDKWQTFMLENAGWNALYAENHDQGRTVSRYCSDDPAYRNQASKMLASTLALQSGTVFVYQGQELAQKNMPKEWGIEYYRDLECLNHWNEVLKEYPNDKEKQQIYLDQYRCVGRDNARTPIQWSSAKYAGWMPESTPESVKPWMDIHPDYAEWNAAKMVADPKSPYHYWRQLLELRKQYKEIFVYGDFELLDVEHESVVTYVRTADEPEGGKKTALVINNWTEEGGQDGFWFQIPKGYEQFLEDEAVLKHLRNYESAYETKKEGDALWIKIRPYEAIVAMI